MVKREIIRITILMLAGMCLSFILFLSNHNPWSFLLIAYVPCMAYGGSAFLKWIWNLFGWFLQMQFMSVVHKSIWGVVLAVIALVFGGACIMVGGTFWGLYRIIRNLIEDLEMDQILVMNGFDNDEAVQRGHIQLNGMEHGCRNLNDDLLYGTNIESKG